jgi:hypothetical protein
MECISGRSLCLIEILYLSLCAGTGSEHIWSPAKLKKTLLFIIWIYVRSCLLEFIRKGGGLKV